MTRPGDPAQTQTPEPSSGLRDMLRRERTVNGERQAAPFILPHSSFIVFLSHLGETVPPRPNGAQVICEGGELRRLRGVVDKLLGFAPRPLQNVLIAYQVPHPESRDAPLA